MGFGLEQSPELILRCYENVSEVLNKWNKQEEATFFKYLNMMETEIKKIFISGIKGIKTVKTSKRIFLSGDAKEELSKKRKELCEYIVFEAEGSNLREVLSHPKVNPIKSYCNDISEIYNVLGIEAARSAFIN